jgi:hypothetical protein
MYSEKRRMAEIQSLLTRHIGVWNKPLLLRWWRGDDCQGINTNNISYLASCIRVCAIAAMQWVAHEGWKRTEEGALQEELLKLGNEGCNDNYRLWTEGFFLGHKKWRCWIRKNREQELCGDSKSEKMPEREYQNDMSTGVLMIRLIWWELRFSWWQVLLLSPGMWYNIICCKYA